VLSAVCATELACLAMCV